MSGLFIHISEVDDGIFRIDQVSINLSFFNESHFHFSQLQIRLFLSNLDLIDDWLKEIFSRTCRIYWDYQIAVLVSWAIFLNKLFINTDDRCSNVLDYGREQIISGVFIVDLINIIAVHIDSLLLISIQESLFAD